MDHAVLYIILAKVHFNAGVGRSVILFRNLLRIRLLN
jgi:hypothetical protein